MFRITGSVSNVRSLIVQLVTILLLAENGFAATTGELVLSAIPDRIRQYRTAIGYGRLGTTHEKLVRKWKYVRFLEALVRTVNKDVTKGDALEERHMASVASFAVLTVIVRDGYLPSTSRGASGFEMKEVNEMIGLFESVIERLVPAIGRSLSFYEPSAKDWDEKQEVAWRHRFRRATTNEPGGRANGKEPLGPEP
jgi:hypothetical protein